MRRSAVLLAALLVFGSGSFGAALEEEADVLALFAGLPERFVVHDTEEAGSRRVFRLRSADPIETGAGGPVYLRASLTISSSTDAGAAEDELGRRLEVADPETGLTYAWDLVTTSDNQILHLHAGCTFSETRFLELARAVLRAANAGGAASSKSFWCRCGNGCRPGAPVSPGADEASELPAVRRAAGHEDQDAEEYDNRLDPSGAWTGGVGELSLMHSADTLSFSYLAVFGPTAHICEGAGVAGLVGRDRYEWVDDQGTVAFVIAGKEVGLEVIEGIASFCGAGWGGDRFTTDGFEPPGECTVAAERSHFYVAEVVDPERRPAYVTRGDRVEVAPIRHTGDEEWLLARFVGHQATVVGMLPRRDLECRASTADANP